MMIDGTNETDGRTANKSRLSESDRSLLTGEPVEYHLEEIIEHADDPEARFHARTALALVRARRELDELGADQ